MPRKLIYYECKEPRYIMDVYYALINLKIKPPRIYLHNISEKFIGADISDMKLKKLKDGDYKIAGTENLVGDKSSKNSRFPKSRIKILEVRADK